jgi:hypothetical protein
LIRRKRYSRRADINNRIQILTFSAIRYGLLSSPEDRA